MSKLQNLRHKIDDIDRKLVDLIIERTKFALEIGKQKIKKNQGIYAPEREFDVYHKVLSENQGLLTSKSLKNIFREIMSAALSAEKKLKVAYLGPVATFTHQASIYKFGSSVEYLAMDSISDVFHSVEKDHADYGVVPIENTTEGAVTHTLDVFIDSDLKICSEVPISISHTLLSNSPLGKIQKIYSNPQVFGQCRIWLRENLPKAELIEVSSTSKAAETASREQYSASISSRLAADFYPIQVKFEEIEDFKTNMTRFLVVGKHVANPTGNDKTSILFSIKDKVGALYEVLIPFKKYRLNLTKIESRPSKKKAWEYYFFVDFEGHQEDPHIQRALKSLEPHCDFIKVLGSYPYIAKDE